MRLSIDRERIPTALFAAASLLLAAFPVAFATATLHGDPMRGEQVYGRCRGCHAIDRNRIGPRHAGLIGRKAGSVPGFDYSPAMRRAGAAGLVWDEETLDKFLENPTHFVPGTRMVYAGVKDAQQRADVIAYLEKAGGDAQHAEKASDRSATAGSPKE